MVYTQSITPNVQPAGYAEMIVVVFQPHAIGWFIDTPPSSFFNLEISGFDIGNGALSGLALRIFDCVDNFRCVHMIENWLLAKLYNVNLPDYYRIGATVARLMEYPSAKVTELADVACLCKKQFERVFGRCVGMRPKEYARVVRFQKSMWLMQNGQCNDADIKNLKNEKCPLMPISRISYASSRLSADGRRDNYEMKPVLIPICLLIR